MSAREQVIINFTNKLSLSADILRLYKVTRVSVHVPGRFLHQVGPG